MVLEPRAQFVATKKLLLAKTVVSTAQGTVPLRVLNPTDEACTVHEDTFAAIAEPATEVSPWEQRNETVAAVSPTNQSANNKPPNCDQPKVPSHLTDLLERSSQHLTDAQRGQLRALLVEFSSVFASSKSDIGRTSLAKHSINTSDAKPIRQPARRLPMHRRDEAETHVQQMLKDGVAEPSSSPWASPVVLVKKEDGSTRFCVDYRKLNDVTVKDSYPFPTADSCFDALAGSRWFSTLDLSSAYWQVEMDVRDEQKTAFTTGSGGLYQFTVMPFGLCNAPATFERLMERVLSGLPWEVCLAYLDHIISHAHTFDEAVARLREVFSRLRDAGLKLSPKKCHLFQQSVTFLGHIVTGEGISTAPDKVRGVNEWPVPTNASELRSFLGLCSYYRRFVGGFAEIARPLHRLTEKDTHFIWTAECAQAFQRLKRSLTSAPVLSYPTTTEPFVLDTDASNRGIGAVLSQVQNGEEKAVAYFSTTLSKTERNYCVTRKELLAIVKAVRRFHHYLYGRTFKVRTDHGALRWLLNFKNPEGQLARWLEALGTYDFLIEHRSGVKHQNEDALSRRPCMDCGHCERAERKEEGVPTAGAALQPTGTDGRKPQRVEVCATKAKARAQPAAAGSSWEEEAWADKWTRLELRDMQMADPDISLLVGWKESSKPRPEWPSVSQECCAVKAYWSQWDRLEVLNGVLYRRWESDAGDATQWQLVVPQSLRDQVLREMHDAKTAGHLGVTKTLGRVKHRFYWHKCSQDVKDWCRRCDSCAARKPPQKKPRSAMKTYNVGAPWRELPWTFSDPCLNPNGATNTSWSWRTTLRSGLRLTPSLIKRQRRSPPKS